MLGTCDMVYDQQNAEGIPSLHLRHISHVRDFDNLPLFNALLVLFTGDLFVLDRNCNRGNLLIFIVLKVAVGQISVVFCGFMYFVNCFLGEVF